KRWFFLNNFLHLLNISSFLSGGYESYAFIIFSISISFVLFFEKGETAVYLYAGSYKSKKISAFLSSIIPFSFFSDFIVSTYEKPFIFRGSSTTFDKNAAFFSLNAPLLSFKSCIE